MAKRKHKTTTHRRRRSRVSGFGSGNAMQTVAGVVIGAVGGSFLGNFIGAKSNDKVAAGATIAAGMFAHKAVKGPMGIAIGHGLIASGGVKLLKAFNVPGVGSLDEVSGFSVGMEDDGMSGLDEVSGFETGESEYQA